MEKRKKTISQEMADIRLDIKAIEKDIAELKVKREYLKKEYFKKKKILDDNFSSLFNFYQKKLIGEENFKTGTQIADLFPEAIRTTYGVNLLVKKITDAAAKSGYYRHIRYISRLRHYAFFKTKQHIEYGEDGEYGFSEWDDDSE